MADSSARTDPFADLLSLVAGPVNAVGRSFDQMRRGSDELMKALENFNATMATLNETAERVNRLLNEFEGPVRALMPQVTRTLQAADDITTRLSGPVDQVIPGLTRLGDTLNSPVFKSLPTDLGAFIDAINELVRRLGPLTQLADTATGLFGLRIPGMSRPSLPPGPAAAPAATAAPAAPAAAAEPADKTTAKVASSKKSASKKPAKAPAAKSAKSTARKPATRRPGTR